MSDKMLMENWRKFLNEEGPTTIDYGDQYQADLETAWMAAISGEDAVSIVETEKCYTIPQLIQRIQNLRRQYEDPEKAEKAIEAGAETAATEVGTYLAPIAGGAAIDLGTGGSTLGAGTAGGVAISAGIALKNVLKAATKAYRKDPPTADEMERFALADKLDLSQEFKYALDPDVIDGLDEKWEAQLQKDLAKFGPDEVLCGKALEKMMDYNQFVQNELDLCLGDYAPLSENKFHDDWRDFLFTEEKE